MTPTQSQDSLVAWIDTQPRELGDDWLRHLEPRKRTEAEFHDRDRRDHRDEDPASSPNRRFYEAATVMRERIDEWIRTRVPCAVFLDYACGNGSTTIEAVRAGASLGVGIDISAVSVRGAAERAAGAGLGASTRFLQRDCEDTRLPDASFDLCVCNGMLHHLDLDRAFPELHRIMRPDGRILCVESLAYNPFIRAYRNRTPHLRTAWEKDHILSLRDLRLASRWFRVEDVRYFLLTAPLATLLPAGAVRRLGLRVGHAIDRVATRVPGVRLWSWMLSFELVKSG
jgi:SAM-dependent methyltransferase